MSQKNKILELLINAYPNYVTNFQLNKICFRYGARLMELKKEGWKIENIRHTQQEWHCRLLQPYKSEQSNQSSLNI